MNSYYKKSILIFGIGIPLMITGILAGVCFITMANIDKKFKIKQKKYTEAEQTRKSIKVLETRVAQNNGRLEQWQELLDTETRGTFLQHWRTSESKAPKLEFSSFPHSWVNQSQGLGKGVNHSSSQVEMKFSATYRSMQNIFLDVEAKLPHMQLDSFSMTTGQHNSKMNFETKYTVWNKN